MKSKRGHDEDSRNSLTQFNKKSVKLKGVIGEIYVLLKENPTVKYLCQKTGKSKIYVAVILNRLIKKGYIKRIDRGVYKVLNAPHDVTMSLTNSNRYFLHNLQIKLLHNSYTHKHILSSSNKMDFHYNPRNGSRYLNLGTTWMISKENIFIQFPESFEIEADSPEGLYKELYSVIESAIEKGEQKFKIALFKDNRINAEIVNLHIAYRESGVAKVLQKSNIKYMLVRDDDDGKGRFLIDMSKGFPEPEFIHPVKAIDDISKWEYLVKKLGSGEMSALFEKDLPTIKKALMLLFPMSELSENVAVATSEVQDKPSYIG